ncbi:acetylcholine receptor subunit gamma isoform X3 [Pangasianodon hypophthalmus]|uniref:acetylcholine receptor subunit gamma isoform X3 n=1 Tax=Pangasianodon hypophthalmus TaxID=310915 RepID=UPI002307251F|nr:acetylcholine receptor subunit gamma isoform X3 [Pangasianodon hypophthalmus]
MTKRPVPALCVWTWTLLSLIPSEVVCNLEGALHGDLMRGYNKNIRPVEKNGDITEVKLKMTLTNLISLNEKEETLTTCVWVEMQWYDYRLRWADRPGFEAYENITGTRIPSKAIWLPDIILENKSQTYSANEIELKLTNEENTVVEWIEIDPEAFTENGEWVIKHRPAKKVVNEKYSRDELDYQEIIFFLIIQRKPLFYIINIIVPCVLFSSLGLLVYFLPAKAGGQKCTMSITILLAQTVFLFLIAKKVPETSQAVPLIGKYLMFVMSVTAITVMNCVVVLNVSLRTPNTHLLTNKVRKVLLNIFPRVLGMRMQRWTPHRVLNADGITNKSTVPLRRHSSLGLIVKADEYMLKTARSELMFSKLKERGGLMRSALEKIRNSLEEDTVQDLTWGLAMASPELQQCVASCKHIAESTKQHNDFQKENEEWFLVARVIDRLCFITMALLFMLGTIGIFLMGHFNQAPALPFPGDPKRYLPEIFTANITGQH